MATSLKNLSKYDPSEVPSAENMKVGVVVSEWNQDITAVLCEGAVNTLLRHQADRENIIIKSVPGTVELTFGAKVMAETTNVDAVICVGAVIKGGTPHFDYVCQSAVQGITQLNMNYSIPFIFCVLTTNDYKQAKDRAGGKHGNKGDEAAVAAIKMISLNRTVWT